MVGGGKFGLAPRLICTDRPSSGHGLLVLGLTDDCWNSTAANTSWLLGRTTGVPKVMVMYQAAGPPTVPPGELNGPALTIALVPGGCAGCMFGKCGLAGSSP